MKKQLLIIAAMLFITSVVYAQPITNEVSPPIVEVAETSNSSTLTICSYTVPEHTTSTLRILITVRRLSDGASRGWLYEGIAEREAGNASVGFSLIDALGNSGDLIALALASAIIDASGNDARVRITGITSTDLIWFAKITGEELTEE